MWYNRTGRLGLRPRTVAGVGAGAGVLAMAWLVGWSMNAAASHSTRATPIQHPTTAAVTAMQLAAPQAVSAPIAAPVDPTQAALLSAKFDVASQPAALDAAANLAAAPPPPPVVSALDAPPPASPPAPEPMEAALQTEAAPAAPVARPPVPTKTGYFTTGAPSAQHLPMP